MARLTKSEGALGTVAVVIALIFIAIYVYAAWTAWTGYHDRDAWRFAGGAFVMVLLQLNDINGKTKR
jgi:hypothetical protein